jgi:hypothetical protein
MSVRMHANQTDEVGRGRREEDKKKMRRRRRRRKVYEEALFKAGEEDAWGGKKGRVTERKCQKQQQRQRLLTPMPQVLYHLMRR